MHWKAQLSHSKGQLTLTYERWGVQSFYALSLKMLSNVSYVLL